MRNRLAFIPLALLAAGPSLAAPPHGPASHGKFCISDFNLGNPTPLPDGRVLFPARPRRGQSYAAVFKGKCLGVRSDSRFVLIRDGSQICEGDRMRPFEPTDIIPGPVCVIDHFEPYTEPPRGAR